MTYKRKTTGAQHAEGSQKHRKSDNEDSESERATTSKSTAGNNSYYTTILINVNTRLY